MVLIIHIALALVSIVIATYNVFVPSELKLKITYVLTIGTLLSAGVLILQGNAPLAKVCFSGIGYIALVTAGIIVTKRRLASLKNS